MRFRKQAVTVLLSSLAMLAPWVPASPKTDDSHRKNIPLIIVRERLHPSIAGNCPLGRLVYGLSYSEFTVLSNGQAKEVIWSVPPCSPSELASEWKAPAGSKARRFTLLPGGLDQLRGFLERPEVKSLTDFMNAGPGVGDYDIEIYRGSRIQRIQVLSLMPNHYELKRDPTLLRVICKSKQIAGDEVPDWCPDTP